MRKVPWWLRKFEMWGKGIGLAYLWSEFSQANSHACSGVQRPYSLCAVSVVCGQPGSDSWSSCLCRACGSYELHAHAEVHHLRMWKGRQLFAFTPQLFGSSLEKKLDILLIWFVDVFVSMLAGKDWGVGVRKEFMWIAVMSLGRRYAEMQSSWQHLGAFMAKKLSILDPVYRKVQHVGNVKTVFVNDEVLLQVWNKLSQYWEATNKNQLQL